MSYDIYLKDPITGTTLELDKPHHMKGGTYAVDGTTEARLNITYNYRPVFCRVFGDNGIRSIYGLSGAASLPMLDKAISTLDDDTDSNYWAATDGNVKLALLQLRALAEMRPDGYWTGD